MFKSIFSRLIAISIAILLIGFSVTGVMLYVYLTGSTLNQKKVVLKASSAEISNYFKQYVDNLQSAGSYQDEEVKNNLQNLSQLYFQQTMDFYSRNLGSYVWIVDDKGHILFSRPNLPQAVLNNMKYDSKYPVLPDEKQYLKVFSLKKELIFEPGDFFGFFKDKAFDDEGHSWLTVENPISGMPSGYNFAVLLHMPVPEVQKVRTEVLQIFLRAVLVAILISIILIYLFSRRLTKPLKQMNDAARVIASGEFKKRVSVKSKDEVGELAASFNQMVTSLENLEDMRRGFIANVSHELRTPMTSIRGFVEGILDGTIPQEKNEYYLTVVRDETNRLNRLVNDLLDLAKMESGEMTLNIRSFDINELLRRCVIKLEGLITKKNLQVNADFEEEDIIVSGDQDAIERVIYNLLHNAIKFTPEEGKITVGTASQRDKVNVWVEDTGIGIDKEEIDLVWDRFYKSDKSRSRDKTGTGLGLAIIKNIINEHKQRIWIESEPGKGTKFTFTLERIKNEITIES